MVAIDHVFAVVSCYHFFYHQSLLSASRIEERGLRLVLQDSVN